MGRCGLDAGSVGAIPPDVMTGTGPGPAAADAEAGRGRLLFIGVDTRGSTIMQLFPRWVELLRLDAAVEGVDLPLGAEPAAYRAVVERVVGDPGIAGALVTSHKTGVYRHGGGLLDELDRCARLCREVSCISKRGGRVRGHAKDPITAGLAMRELLEGGRRRDPPDQVLCLGAGGAGTAITVRLLATDPAPSRLVVADADPARLEALGAIHQELPRAATGPASHGSIQLRTVAGAEDTDALLSGMPPGSLVVNATGVGKDLPGSPLSDRARFPRGAVVWDLNYRGDLGFLRQARSQAAARGLVLHDGWRYFLYGWSAVVAEVFGLDLTSAWFDRLADTAEPLRPPTPA
jgi:shikimate dehydrogenase